MHLLSTLTLNLPFQLWRLWRGGPLAERTRALFILTGLVLRGVRPARWSTELLEPALEPADSSADEGAARLMAYYACLDTGDDSAAAAHLERALVLVDRQPARRRAPYYLEAAYAGAIGQLDLNRALAYLRQAEDGAGIEPYAFLRAEAALLIARGLPTSALEQLDLADALLAAKPERTGLDHLEASLLQELRIKGLAEIRPLR